MPTNGVLTFDDYQMSADILVTVIPSRTGQSPLLNHVVIASIQNVALDPLESTAIPPPTASTTATNAMLNILSQQAMVVPYEVPPESGPAGLGSGLAGTNVFNFERATLRCTEQVNGSGVAYVGVLRATVDASQATAVNYQIDYLYPFATANNTFMNPYDWEVPLQPGSDYAGIVTNTPTGVYSDNVHSTNVTGTLNWAAGDTTVKFIQIPIIDESPRVQFNEDLLVQLWLPGPPYPDPTSDRVVGLCADVQLDDTVHQSARRGGGHVV